jgi:hypothetical protein
MPWNYKYIMKNPNNLYQWVEKNWAPAYIEQIEIIKPSNI